jgi:hypothetical protein
MRFFIPLSLSALLISLSHSVINAGLARLPQAEIMISAYSIASSFGFLLMNPVLVTRQISASLATNPVARAKVYRYLIVSAIIPSILIYVVASTPDLFSTMIRIANMPSESSYLAMTIFAGFLLLPIVHVNKEYHQGILSRQGYTKIVFLSELANLLIIFSIVVNIRILPMARFPWLLPVCFIILGDIVGAFFLYKKRQYILQAHKPPTNTFSNAQSLSYWHIFNYCFPLYLSGLVGSVTMPLTYFILGRSSVAAEYTIAAFSVAWGIGMLFLSIQMMLNQVSLRYYRPFGNNRVLILFFTSVGALLSLMLLTVAFSPLGHWILLNMIAVSPVVAQDATFILRWIVLLIPMRAAQEFFHGAFMQLKFSTAIGKGRIISTSVVIICLLLFSRLQLFAPTVMIILSMILGEAVELFYLLTIYRKILT